MPFSEAIVEVSRLRKSYGPREVLHEVSFEVRVGEIVGLLGPNGAGKTTTLSILATLLTADQGEVRIAGYDSHLNPQPIRRRIGLVPQSIALYPSLTVFQNIELFARIHGLRAREAQSASEAALAQVDLSDRAHERVSSLSGGLQRRLNLACGIVHRPNILLLDEPTVGVDPQSRAQILDSLRILADAGAAIMYSTHYMEEVERLCDRALLIDQGSLIASGTITELVAMPGSHHRMEVIFRGKPPPGLFAGMAGISEATTAPSGESTVLMLADLGRIAEVLERARGAGCPVLEFNLHSPNLSDAFMALTGHALRDTGADHG